jgi:glycosyltransferase involved in cell wall biosynthesis
MGFTEQQLHVIPHGFDPAPYQSLTPRDRSMSRAALNIPDDAFVFLNVSSTIWNKGIGPLVAAFARHRLRNENAILVLKGGDALYGTQVRASVLEAEALCSDVTDPRVRASLRYLPDNLTQAGMAALYHACDAYVSPYRAEGFNLPVLEALGAGLPVIVTAGGATDDYCPAQYSLKIEAVPSRKGDSVYLEPDLESLVHNMQTMADDGAVYRAAALQGRREIIDRYSWRAVTRALGDLLDGRKP